LPQGISPGIQSRVDALDAHMNRKNQNNPAPQGSQPGAPAEQTGGQPGANAQYAPQTNVGTFQDRAKALEARMNPVAGGAANTGPTQPLPQGISPGIQSRVEALDAHMNRTNQNNQAPQAAQPGANVSQSNVGTFQDRLAAAAAHMNGQVVPRKAPPDSVRNQQNNP
jgi:hypothetical protein